MIRPFTLITALMFVLSGAYLFEVKHRSQMLDDQLAATTQATRLDVQRIRVLRAQWALEVDPSRLAQLSAEFTKLQPMQPSQLVTLASLSNMLPAPGSAVPGQNPEGDMQAIPVVASDGAHGAGDALVAAAAPGLPLPPPVAPVSPAPTMRLAKVAPVARVENGKPVARMANVEAIVRSLPAAHRNTHTSHDATAHMYAENRPAYSGPVLPAPLMQSALASQAPIPQAPVGARVMPVRVVSAAPQVPPMPQSGGSMLGMAQTMGRNGSGN